MIGALLQAVHLGVEKGQRPWVIPCAKRGRGISSLPCAQSGRRTEEKGFPTNGRMEGWKVSFHGMFP